MFGRIVKYIVLLLVFVAIGVWFAENPGIVAVEWQGLIVEVPIGLALIAGLVVVAICAFLYRMWVFLRKSPQTFGHFRSERRNHKGYDALTKGMVAVAAGETTEARKHAKKAHDLLDDPSLTMLLSAQAAQLDGDEQAATRFFEDMSKTKGMEFLGLRGLLNQASARGDMDEALELAQQAYRLKPKTQWLAQSLLELQLKKGQWAEAEATLSSSIKHKLVDAKEGARQKAALMVERAGLASAEGLNDQAIKLLGQALKQDGGLVPAALEQAKLLGKANKRRKAISLIEEVWRKNPHPDLYALYQEMQSEPDALKRVNLAEKLAGQNRKHIESRIIIARAALEAQLWGEARDELKVLLVEAPSSRVFALMAELVETENNDLSGAREWLRKATQAQADPAWVCHTCGDVSADWSAVCPKCHGFDTKAWQTPSQANVETAGALEEEKSTIVEAELVEPAAKSTAAQ
ncbi:putative enzyme of heme biosynthesis (HemY-like) [Candidatus Terasakiella magnetica]|uniref:Putative enzyme of heme biosynthesis (HemY-like) n=1 Tax=Candidatus Terasakiella magnetica TaxID=1867952 RepID=A0A1C3RFZ3_9PROT|nr:heme biosynthesis HemY N-terminal domain-containing protein [Candidatus Terasakiella magnetica]SCA56179.1 putative enzyme of heme biosynthesis (HemY-like) [Candidatus Terasakiella magnetica]